MTYAVVDLERYERPVDSLRVERMVTDADIRVLIVDDSLEVRRALQDQLAALDWVRVVAEAATAASALHQAMELRPDVVLLDINLPDRSGVWVLRALTQAGVESEVVVLTNHGGSFYRRKCLEAGARRFLDKHTEFEAVPRVLAQIADVGNGHVPEAS